MSMALGGGGGGGGRRARRNPGARMMSNINVTPMVDVMLVLLVVFMITAPLMTVGVSVDLPRTAASNIVGQDEPLVVSINGEGKLFLQDTEIKMDQMVPRLNAITSNKRDTRIFLRGDRAIPYGEVMELMGTLNLAGFNRVALITVMPKGPDEPKAQTR